jgi:hypothetical protein
MLALDKRESDASPLAVVHLCLEIASSTFVLVSPSVVFRLVSES